jgi:uncharacterized protein (DUF302 family)
MGDFTIRRPTALSYDEALARVPDLLKAEGFGILTQIDVKETLKQKIGVDFRRYKILGACNPPLAHRALSAVTEIGVMLPCNVIVYEGDDGKTVVSAVDPMATIAASQPALAEVAAEVRARLARALGNLP